MIAWALASACRLVTGATVEWRCDPNGDSQRIYFANHTSHLDFIVIWSALPPRLRPHARPVAGLDYWNTSALRRYVARDVFRAVLIERGHSGTVAAAQHAIEQMRLEMGERDSLIVFPEGTRSVDGRLGCFKSGLYHLARAKPAAELTPVLLENLDRILPKGQTLPVPMLSRVTFGAPLQTCRDDSKDRFLERARMALLALGRRNDS
jgi:1-acyl-sn-glycerol-3-phosphate acyltransferase